VLVIRSINVESDLDVSDGRFRNSRVAVGRVRTNTKQKYQIGIWDLKNLIDCFHKSLLISVYRHSTSTRNGSSPEYRLDDVAGYLLNPDRSFTSATLRYLSILHHAQLSACC
jgi:hypothetical protein